MNCIVGENDTDCDCLFFSEHIRWCGNLETEKWMTSSLCPEECLYRINVVPRQSYTLNLQLFAHQWLDIISFLPANGQPWPMSLISPTSSAFCQWLEVCSFLQSAKAKRASAPALASMGDQEVEVSRLYHCPSWADQVRELPAIGERICQ